MSAYTLDCPPLDACGPCGTLPGGFVRLRYFFGKRMGVADFVDEQRYHSGKQRFHNQRLHGSGVVCGLAVTRDSNVDVLLRVGKGAAIDACGREIVVGYDQCIDLDAWFQRELVERRATDSTWPTAALDSDGNLPLVIVVRYRDCASGPEPAPRDTCSCDAAGCDFGRVREEFELDVVTASDPQAAPAPGLEGELERAIARALGGAQLGRGLAAAAVLGCPDPATDGWLLLASFTATLTTTGSELHITDVGPIQSEASLLARTALLQELLTRELGASLEPGALVPGPEFTGFALEVEPAPSTIVSLRIALSLPLIAETVPLGAFTLTRLAPSAAPTPGWSSIACETTYVAPTATTPPQLEIRVDNVGGELAADGLYRLALDPVAVPPSRPIVDDSMRPLRPLRGAIQFGLGLSGTDLVLLDAPYAR